MLFFRKNKGSKKLIFLNGTSSVGKSAIAQNLQAILSGKTYILSIDFIIELADKRYSYEQSISSLMSSMMASSGAFMKHHDNLIIDCVLDIPDKIPPNNFIEDAIESLKLFNIYDKVNFYKIKVVADDDILELRESKRKDRKSGLARYQKEKIHVGIEYDFEIDTSSITSSNAALNIAKYIDGNKNLS